MMKEMFEDILEYYKFLAGALLMVICVALPLMLFLWALEAIEKNDQKVVKTKMEINGQVWTCERGDKR